MQNRVFFCVVEVIYFRSNVIVLFFGNQISKWRSFEKRAIFDLLFTFFSHQEKVTKIPSAHISLTYMQVFCSPYWLFLPYQFWKKNTNLSDTGSLWYKSWCWILFASFWNNQQITYMMYNDHFLSCTNKSHISDQGLWTSFTFGSFISSLCQFDIQTGSPQAQEMKIWQFDHTCISNITKSHRCMTITHLMLFYFMHLANIATWPNSVKFAGTYLWCYQTMSCSGEYNLIFIGLRYIEPISTFLKINI